jgi:hypothetical protein
MAPTHADQILASTRIFGSGATVDNEGSLIVIGSSSPFSNGMSQAFLLKYVSSLPDSPNGQLSCMKTFGNGEPLDTFGYSVATDSSNSIYTAGSTQTFGGEDYDVFLQKYDQSSRSSGVGREMMFLAESQLTPGITCTSQDLRTVSETD